jgi:spectinomycin phosphotransferase
MIQRPDLSDGQIAAVLAASYAIQAARVEFLPIGNDASAWAFRAEEPAGGARYFVKVRRLPLDEIALSLPRCLQDLGILPAAAPLPAADGRLWQPAGAFGLVVYPYIEGANGMDAGLSPAQWVRFGAVLKQIHTIQLPPAVLDRIPRETFRPKTSPMVRRLQARIAQGDFRSVYETRLVELWQARSDTIARIIAWAEELGRQLRAAPRAVVLCHADIHTANLLIDPLGELHIVDWDQPVLAPKERDLMFVAGEDSAGRVVSQEERLFFEGYGACDVDPLALAYYRCEWVVQELGDYGERVFFLDDLGAETKAESLRFFAELFAPGDVVDGAEAAYAVYAASAANPGLGCS